jgi:peptidase M23-like protein/putative peptidoglycan binding protein
MKRLGVCALVVLACLPAGSARAETGRPPVAALQVALISRLLYFGTVDGVQGGDTADALRDFQRQAGLHVDGVLGPRTRAALGPWAAPELGSRDLERGASGWDVAELQFLLAWHGFPSGHFTGDFEDHVIGAVKRFQRWAGLTADGVAGASTIAALHGPLPSCPLRLAWPLRAPITSPFAPRDQDFHPGIDLGAAYGTAVRSAMSGRVTWADFLPGGWGNLVVVTGALGVQTLYAHLSEIEVEVGDSVSAGTLLGLVGATGDATGPHLHFEVRVRGAAVNPVPALPRS